MIVAGAEAGVYDLKTMAFESMEGFLRAGTLLRIISPLILARRPSSSTLLGSFGDKGFN